MTQQEIQKQTPTQTIRNWIKDFVTKPNPIFGDLPPCPFAQKAIVDGKVAFVELDSTAGHSTLYHHIWGFDFDKQDVLVLIAEQDHFTADQTVEMTKNLNSYFMPRDVVVLEDHPEIDERVQQVKMNNGEYTLFLAQRLSKLNRFSKMLESGPYYENWSKEYLEEVKGFRDQKNPKV